MEKSKDLEIPLQKGSLTGSSGSVVHQVADVRVVIIDATVNGNREAYLAMITGGQVVVIENSGKPAQQWMRDAVLAKVKGLDSAKKDDGSVEQA